MAKRIPKTEAPEAVKTRCKAQSLSRFCEVYIPQAPSVFTYGIPEDLPEDVRVRRGSVVWVQFATRKKPMLAVVAKLVERPAFDVRCVYPHASGYVFSERYMEALEWVARYYISTPMKALDVFWPADFEQYLDAVANAECRMLNAELRMQNAECRMQNFVEASAATELARALPSRSQNECEALMQNAECRIDPETSLRAPLGVAIQELGKQNLVEARAARPEVTVRPEVPPLTDEQQAALDALVEELPKSGFRGALLHGVTGSGKTRVYQELALAALRQGKKVLILVPEIGLTPQTAKRFEDFLQVPVHVLHSALSAPKKRAAYVSVLAGEARVVLGTRSAILAPFDFDVVILDEEHDSSFKQQDPAPRYHTRELAYHLAHKYGALVVLGSATPCLETFHNAKEGHLKYLTLKKRATAVELPQVNIVDMGKVRQQQGILMSPDLRDALTQCIAGGHQAIILMNRRGYSKIRVCSDCGETLYCKHCHVPLVYHKQHKALLCHYCNLLYPVNSPCFSCGAETFEFVGGAIEKLEEEIQEWVPKAKVIRMDRDTTQNVGSIEKILESFRNREYNILLGTQMVAKGHDFPGVHLVGVVGADSGLGIPDFRGGERLFQLLSQTAGRAGRAEGGGRVLIQTLNPNEPVMQFAIHHDFAGFAEREMDERRDAFYPPFCKLVSISMGSKDESLLKKAVAEVERICRAEKNLLVLGPVDAFIAVVQNVHWTKLYLKTNDLNPVRRILHPLVNNSKGAFLGVDLKIEIE